MDSHPSDIYWAPMSVPGSREQHVQAQERYEQSLAWAAIMEGESAVRVAYLEKFWAENPDKG